MTAKRDEPLILTEPGTIEVIPGRSLHRKLAEVMAEVGRIPKNGTAPTSMGGFKFVQVGDAADAIRKALGERGVSMLPTQVEIASEAEHQTRSGGTMTTQTIRTTWTLTDGDTGEQAVIQSLGTGADSGDKFSPKAQSNAMKYALLMGFLLSTGDDPELSDSSDRGARQPTPMRDERDAMADAARDRIMRTETPVFTPADAELSGLIGTAEIGKSDADFELRQTPTGYKLGFRLVEGRKGLKVIALDSLAEQIAEYRQGIEGFRVTCWGRLVDQTFTPKPKDENDKPRPVTYQVLTLSRLKVGALELTGAPEEPAEAETAELFPVTA